MVFSIRVDTSNVMTETSEIVMLDENRKMFVRYVDGELDVTIIDLDIGYADAHLDRSKRKVFSHLIFSERSKTRDPNFSVKTHSDSTKRYGHVMILDHGTILEVEYNRGEFSISKAGERIFNVENVFKI